MRIKKFLFILTIFWIQTYTILYAQDIETIQFTEAYKKFRSNEHQKSLNTFHRLATRSQSKTIKIKSYTALAQYYSIYSNTDSTIHFCHKALELIGKQKDDLSQKRRALIYNSLGIAFQKKGHYDESIQWHIKGIEVSESVNFRSLYFKHTHGLAHTFMMKGEFEKSIVLFKECIQSKHDIPLIYGSHINLGVIQNQQQKFLKSLENMRKAQKLCLPYEDGDCLVTTSLNISMSLLELGRISDAYYEILKTEEYAIAYDLSPHYPNIYLLKGKIYEELNKFEQAKSMWNKGLRIASQNNDFEIIKSAYSYLEELALEEGEFKKAYELLEKKRNYIDSISAIQEHEKIRELEVKYFSLKKKKEILNLRAQQTKDQFQLENQQKEITNLQLQKKLEIEQQEHSILLLKHDSIISKHHIEKLQSDQFFSEQEIKKQRNLRIFITIAAILFLLPLTGLLRVNRKKLKTQRVLNDRNEEIAEQRIATLLQKNEFELLKAEIHGENKEKSRIAQELHDSIGGNLAAIRLQIAEMEQSLPSLSSVNSSINETYEQVRNISHSLIPKKFKQTAFTILVKGYMDSIQQASPFSVHFTATPEEEINQLDETYLVECYKIFQELINNTIKHAKSQNVFIQMNLINDEINLLFEDDGVGFNPKTVNMGIGLQNIQNRIEKLQGKFHIDTHKQCGVIVNIEIPLIEKS